MTQHTLPQRPANPTTSQSTDDGTLFALCALVGKDHFPNLRPARLPRTVGLFSEELQLAEVADEKFLRHFIRTMQQTGEWSL